MWSADLILESAIAALRAEEGRLNLEHGYRGVDSLEEVELHPVLSAGLAGALADSLGANWGVLREQPYPAEWRGKKGKKRPLPNDPDRQRCDLVLTPGPGQVLADELRAERAAAALRATAEGTLFQQLAASEPVVKPAGVDAGDAFWLEVKVVGQYCYVGGVPGPNSSYASQLVRGVSADLRKLRDDRSILHGGAMLVLFTAAAEVAEHDLMILSHRCLDAGLPIRSPVRAGLAIPDRIGNTWCSIWLAELAKT